MVMHDAFENIKTNNTGHIIFRNTENNNGDVDTVIK